MRRSYAQEQISVWSYTKQYSDTGIISSTRTLIIQLAQDDIFDQCIFHVHEEGTRCSVVRERIEESSRIAEDGISDILEEELEE